ncbi:MAG: hypothetical protein JJU19_17695 [Pararhodobacter sp.]|nr:hypothetical protein [Pararhodobacter sp.]
MLLKVVSIFLIFMLVMASVQKLFGLGRPPGRTALDRLRCPNCKRVNMGGKPAPCDRPDCTYR